MAEANPSFSVIASSVIAIGCDSDDHAIVVEGCQRLALELELAVSLEIEHHESTLTRRLVRLLEGEIE